MVAKTPPMGWNSWDCYGAAVREDAVRANAEFMSRELKQYGWEYVTVDIQWSEPTAENHDYHPFVSLEMDEYGRLIPAVNRFPSSEGGKGFKPLADYVHSLGLKFGIHIMRGIPRQAVHQNVTIKGTKIRAREIASTYSICYWNTDMYGIDAGKEGAAAYYDSLFELYASWDVDFIKVDDICREFHWEEIKLIREAIDKCQREMVLSLSPGPAPIEKAEFFKEYANMWRITDDFWDKWELLYNMFERAATWCTHAGSGHWPDADMLPIGAILQDYSPENRTKFTKSEQITMLTLWNMMRSPLIIGGEMTKFDEFTMSLLTNPEILEIGKDSFGGHPVWKRTIDGCEWIDWTAYRKDGDAYLAVFRTNDFEEPPLEFLSVSVDLAECGFDPDDISEIKELWSKVTLSCETNDLTVKDVPVHGAKVYRIIMK